MLHGNIPVLDVRYGNVWTNINHELFRQTKAKLGDIFCVDIYYQEAKRYGGKMPYVKSFGYVPKGQPLIYINDLLKVSVALNRDNFAAKYRIGSGNDWTIALKKCAN